VSKFMMPSDDPARGYLIEHWAQGRIAPRCKEGWLALHGGL
jgi:hypothetical protein